MKYLKKDFDQTNKQDIRKIVAELESSNYSEASKFTLKIIIRRFFKWLKNSKDYPTEVAWLHPTKNKLIRKLPEQMLTEQDVLKLVDVAKNEMDKALILCYYESGCRVTETLSLRIKNVIFDDRGAVIVVNGKTGPRRIRIVGAVPYLQAWLNKHLFKNDPESWLWLNRSNRLLRYEAFTDRLRILSRRAKINKPINSHLFRHSRATFLANHLTESQLREMFGWTKDSKTVSIYVHLSGRDVDQALLKLYGINPDQNKEKDTELKPKECARCKEINEATNRFCKNCGFVLDSEAIIQQAASKRGSNTTKC